MKHHSHALSALAFALLGASALGAAAQTAPITPTMAPAMGGKHIRITIENLTTGQGFGPSIFYTHGASATPLFKVGEAASGAIARVAEEGNIGGIAGMVAGGLGKDFGAASIAINTLPGTSRTLEIDVDKDHPMLSGAWMLGMTNDGFTGIAGVDAYALNAPKTLDLMGYDAGSEKNSEKKDFMPALGGLGRDPENGMITLHKGIRGDADAPKAWNWDVTKPVAHVTLTPVEAMR